MSTASLLADMYMQEVPKTMEFKFGGWGTKKKTAIIVGSIAVIAAIGAGVGYFLWSKKKKETEQQQQ